MRFIVLTSIFAATMVAACSPASSGTFSPKYFKSSLYPYAVLYKGLEGSEIAGRNWRVDNFRQEGSKLIPKTGDAYWVERSYDTDDDGTSDLKAREPFYEVLLEHREKDASLWIRTVPVSNNDRSKELRVFGERYVESAAGAGHIAVHFGAEVTVSVEKRFASRVVSVIDCEVGGRPAHLVDFEVANVDQLQLSDAARWSRGRVAFIRTGYERSVTLGARETVSYPVLMIVGLSAAPAEFAGLGRDFDSLMGRIALARSGNAKARIGHTCTVQAPPPTLATPEPAATAGGEAPPSPETTPSAPEAAPNDPAPTQAAPTPASPP